MLRSFLFWMLHIRMPLLGLTARLNYPIRAYTHPSLFQFVPISSWVTLSHGLGCSLPVLHQCNVVIKSSCAVFLPDFAKHSKLSDAVGIGSCICLGSLIALSYASSAYIRLS